MKNKIKFLINQSINKKIKTKWFKIINILLLILIVAGFNIDVIIKSFGGDFEENNIIYVVDNVDSFDSFNNNFTLYSETINDFQTFEIINSDKSVEVLEEELLDDDDFMIVEINHDQRNYISANIVSYNPIDTITRQVLDASLNNVKSEYALLNSDVDPDEFLSILNPITISEEHVNPELDEDSEARDILSSGVLIIFLVPFFILVVLLVQMIGAEINDEKTTRGMEIIISNVPPKVHFFAKIVSSTGFVIIQSALLLFYSIVGLLSRNLFSNNLLDKSADLGISFEDTISKLSNSGILDSLVQALPLIFILLLVSFFAYALLAGILASMTTSIEDYQQLQTPLMIILMAGYYIGIMASVFEGSLFIKIISYIPFISALVAPIIYLLDQTTIIDLIISNVLLIGTCYLLFKYGIRVYKVGILNYSSKDLWKKIFKSMKEKN